MAATLVLGLLLGDLRQQPAPETMRWATVHRLSGVAAALAVVLVASIVVTYFIGTSRWCREVAEAYALDPALVRRSVIAKRKAFPWAASAMLVSVGIVALGGAADPATLRSGTENWVTPHLLGAFAGMGFILFSFWMLSDYIRQQNAVINETMAEVRRIRVERGLGV